MIRRRSIGHMAILVTLAVWATLNLFPMYWMVQTAVTPENEILTIPPTLFPSRITWENSERLFRVGLVPRWIVNSLIIAGSVMVLGVFISSLAGYAFAKIPFPGRRVLFAAVIATMLIPGEVTLLPSFLLLSRMGLRGTLWSVILPSLVMPFHIFLFRQYISTIPDSFIDAARIDGASEARIFLHVILPMSRPVLAASSIFIFVGTWNSFLWPLVMLDDPRMYPLTVGLTTLQEQHIAAFGLQMAGATVAAVPMIIVFFLFQKHFIKGLGAGGVVE